MWNRPGVVLVALVLCFVSGVLTAAIGANGLLQAQRNRPEWVVEWFVRDSDIVNRLNALPIEAASDAKVVYVPDSCARCYGLWHR